MVGGGSVHFTTNYWRFHPEDFHERSVLGAIPGADLRDWPITYDDLEPYYTKAEWDLGISGLGGSNPFDGPRSKPYPLPPMPVKSSGVLFERGAKKLGLHPFPAPLAVISQQYRGRAGLRALRILRGVRMRSGREIQHAGRVGSRCRENRPLRDSSEFIRPENRSGKDGRVTGAIYFDADGKRRFSSAPKPWWSAPMAPKRPRLLLMSKSNAFPARARRIRTAMSANT